MLSLLVGFAKEQDLYQNADGYSADATIVLSTGEKVTGLLSVDERDHTVSVFRVTEGEGNNRLYADVPRHYSIDAVIGAYYAEGS